MALERGGAAMILYYDIAPDAIEDHDDWHTHEHIPERLSVPGFLRASRWVAAGDGPRYLVVYEVAGVQVLSGAAYRERLDNPTPWTARMMHHFRGMVRGFCAVAAASGQGFGSALLSIRYVPAAGREGELREWLEGTVLAGISSQPGLAGACLLEPAAQPPMSREQAIRGKDADLPCVLLVSGYDANALARIAAQQLADAEFERHGAAAGALRGNYRFHFLLSGRQSAAA